MKNKQSDITTPALELEELNTVALGQVVGGISPGDYTIPAGWPGLPASVRCPKRNGRIKRMRRGRTKR
jgi:hypothetical protein